MVSGEGGGGGRVSRESGREKESVWERVRVCGRE